MQCVYTIKTLILSNRAFSMILLFRVHNYMKSIKCVHDKTFIPGNFIAVL